MVADVEPVAYIFTFAVDGYRLVSKGFENDDGYEFFRELKGAVVVGAVCDENWKLVGIGPSADKVVAGCLAGGIGRMRVVRCFFGEMAFCTETPINFIRGNVEKTETIAGWSREVFMIGAGRLQESEGAGNVGPDKVIWAIDGSVHMAFGGEMHDPIRSEFGEDALHRCGVANITL